MALRILPDAAYAREALTYNPRTGAFRWNVRPPSHFVDAITRQKWNTRHAGRPAGSISSQGYLTIVIGYKRYLAHRLAWLLVHGSNIPTGIDHIDGNPLNNRANNLRAASREDNMANAKMRRDNTTGVKGVGIWHGRYRARIRRDGREYTLGVFDTLREATAARRKAAIRMHGAFARHD